MHDETNRFEVAETKTCVEIDCDREFEITVGEKEFFESKNMSLPKRCKPCRHKKRQQSGDKNGKQF